MVTGLKSTELRKSTLLFITICIKLKNKMLSCFGLRRKISTWVNVLYITAVQACWLESSSSTLFRVIPWNLATEPPLWKNCVFMACFMAGHSSHVQQPKTNLPPLLEEQPARSGEWISTKHVQQAHVICWSSAKELARVLKRSDALEHHLATFGKVLYVAKMA